MDILNFKSIKGECKLWRNNTGECGLKPILQFKDPLTTSYQRAYRRNLYLTLPHLNLIFLCLFFSSLLIPSYLGLNLLSEFSFPLIGSALDFFRFPLFGCLFQRISLCFCFCIPGKCWALAPCGYWNPWSSAFHGSIFSSSHSLNWRRWVG